MKRYFSLGIILLSISMSNFCMEQLDQEVDSTKVEPINFVHLRTSFFAE
jgi:hypothetical protein